MFFSLKKSKIYEFFKKSSLALISGSLKRQKCLASMVKKKSIYKDR